MARAAPDRPPPRRLAVLGSTGSIGLNTLAVLRGLPGRFQVVGLSAGARWRELAAQAREFKPEWVALAGEAGRAELARELAETGCAVRAGTEELAAALASSSCDLVLLAIVGQAGLAPAFAALGAGADLALANKEALVMAGPLLLERARALRRRVLPVDSEHSAVFQLLEGRRPHEVRRVTLTASGGPFRELPAAEMERVTAAMVLNHPTWKMGPKITTDSATLMNKALEVIEACRLFDLEPERVNVVIHPQSIVHALVTLADGATLAHLGPPDMRLPIQYALTWPERRAAPVAEFDPAGQGLLTFSAPDHARFPALALGYEAARRGGTAGAALSAANEEAVALFLAGRLPFTALARLAGRALSEHQFIAAPDLAAIADCAEWSRRKVQEWASSAG